MELKMEMIVSTIGTSAVSLQQSIYQAPAASVGIDGVGKTSNSDRWPTMVAWATVLMWQKQEFNPHNDDE